MTRIARPVTGSLAALVLALAGCGADPSIPDASSPGPEPSTSPSSPASIPATPSPDRSGSAAPLSRTEQATLDQELREATDGITALEHADTRGHTAITRLLTDR